MSTAVAGRDHRCRPVRGEMDPLRPPGRVEVQHRQHHQPKCLSGARGQSADGKRPYGWPPQHCGEVHTVGRLDARPGWV